MPSVDNIERWKDDYNDMIISFIYEDKPKTFDELIKRMEELTTRLREMTLEGDIIETE